MLDILDGYTIKARLFPVVLSTAPVLALIFIGSSWSTFGIPEGLSLISIVVLLFAGSDLARRAGRRIESQLFSTSGGKPRNLLLSHGDITFDDKTKQRYRQFLSNEIGLVPPSIESEHELPSEAHRFYDSCYAWLRENTRDKDKYALLLSENVSYGFRRNLLGLKKFGLICNILTLVLAASLHFYPAQTFRLDSDRLLLVLALSSLHFTYFIFFVTRKSVIDASYVYAVQLTRSIETFSNRR